MKYFTLFLMSLVMSCSTHIHNIEEMTLEGHIKGMFPNGVSYANGQEADLRLLQEKAIVLFFASENNPQIPELATLLEGLAVDFHYRLAVVAINAGPSDAGFEESFKKYDEAFFAVDEKLAKKLVKRYDVKATPTLIVLGKDGKVVDRDATETLLKNYPRLAGTWE